MSDAIHPFDVVCKGSPAIITIENDKQTSWRKFTVGLRITDNKKTLWNA